MGILLALVSSALFGAADFIGGFATRSVDVRRVVIFSQAAGLSAVAAFAFLFPYDSVRPADLAWGAAAGLAGMLGLLALFQGLAFGRIAVVSPAAAVTGAVVPVAVGVALGERPGMLAVAGVLIALPAVLLISQTPDNPGANNPEAKNIDPETTGEAPAPVADPVADGQEAALWRDGLGVGLLAGLGFGAFFSLIAQSSDAAGMWPLVAARVASVGVLATVTAATVGLALPRGRTALIIVTAGILDVTANAAFVLSTRWTLLAFAAVITSLYPGTTLLLARVVLHERTHPVQRVGLVLAAASVVAIALA